MAKKFVELVKNKRYVSPVIRKLPIIVDGEKSVSAFEPVKTINKMLDEAEKDNRVISSSFHVGYLRQDHDKLGVAVVVVPNTMEDVEYCEGVADKVASYVWDHRQEFQFTSDVGTVSEVVDAALEYSEGNVVSTDSGDNCGAGAFGQNTLLLKEVLSRKTDKRILIAGVNDPKSHDELLGFDNGSQVQIELGTNEDVYSESVKVDGVVKIKGHAIYGHGVEHIAGETVTVNVNNVDIIVLDTNLQYGTLGQFKASGHDFHDYDIVIVKMGYLDVGLVPETKYHIMALTPGPTNQNIHEIDYQKIKRPMWPLDEFEYLEKEE